MELKVFFAILLLSPFLAYNVNAQIYDITKYGGKPDADIGPALADTWKAACEATTPGKIVIPGGTWTLSQAHLTGPCKAPIEFEVQGTVQAYSDPHKLPNKEWEWITINYVDSLTLSGGGVLDGMGAEAWKLNDCNKNQNCMKLPINLSLNFINNSFIHDLTTKDSKNFHVNCISSYNVTFQRFHVSAPGDAPNTDGIHIGWSSKVSVLDTIVETGDDCISMGDKMTEIIIKNVTCGPGHGISIGSLGKNVNEKDITGVSVTNCTFINTQNGVRVKTWPSAPAVLTISDLVFEDLTMINASSPVIIDQEYCPWNQCKLDQPSLIQISKVKINNVRGTCFGEEGVTFRCSSSKPCQDVQIGDIDLTFNGPLVSGKTSSCNNVKPTFTGKQNPPICG